MSAIIITQAGSPHERSRLNPPRSGRAGRSYTEPQTTSAGTSGTATPTPTPSESSYLLRSAPLKDSISTLRFVVICTGVWSANFVFAFQSTAIPTLAPGIGSHFNHAELGSYLGSLFSLANAAVIPLYGVFMDALGRRFAMDTACLFFGLGTVGCALSPNMYWLIASRTVAGLGGGGLLTVSSVIVTDLVPLRDRGLYQGIMMTIFGTGSMLGGPVAGLLMDRYGWPWSFWVQVPVIIFCALLVSLFLPEAPIPPTHRSLLSGLASLDWAGSLLLIGSTTTLILGFSFHTSFLQPWSAPIVWGNLLASGLAAIALVLLEGRLKNPLIPLEMFGSRHTASIMVSGFVMSMVAQAFQYQIPVYFTVIVNSSTAEAGVILSVCGGLGLAVGSLLAGQHIRRGGKYRLLGVLSLLPSVAAGFIASRWTPSWPWWGYWATFFPNPFGYSIYLCVNLIALVSAVDSKRMPKATALLYTVRTLGGTIGVALGSSVQIGVLTQSLRKAFEGVPQCEQIVDSILHSKAAIRLLPSDLQASALAAYAHSISVVWVCCGFLACLSVLSASFLEERDLHQDSGPVKSSGGGTVEDGFGEGLGGATIEPSRR